MSNAHAAYLKHARRVAWLMAKLQRELRRRKADMMRTENIRDWPAVGSLCHVEELLRNAVCFLYAVTEEELNDSLNKGGQGDE
jgi:hypothetical protein